MTPGIQDKISFTPSVLDLEDEYEPLDVAPQVDPFKTFEQRNLTIKTPQVDPLKTFDQRNLDI